jgi:hypothetical protein
MKRLRVLLLITVCTLAPILVLVAAIKVGHSLAARSGVASIKIVSPAENALVQADEEYALSNEVAGERKEITSIMYGWMAQEGLGYTARKEAMSYRDSILGNM